ncbi:MAG: class I SAM-dependent methyltransferase [Acidimicrobiales bacterium]
MANTGMAEYWNGRPANVWVTEAERFDSILAPFGRRLLTSAVLKPGEQVLDVGCGNGAVSLEAARTVGRDGQVTGLDLSAPMLEVARRRAKEQGIDVSFVQGDAQTASFDHPFDVVLSRFGVMFFDGPQAAFANLAKATRPGGRLCFVCWQELFANEWIAVPAMAMVAHVGIPELPEPGAPGPFALADAGRTRGLLESAGWSEVTVEQFSDPMPMGRDPEDVVAFMLSDEMGRRLVEGKDPEAVNAGTEAAVKALRPFATPEGVVLEGAYWLVTARNG